MKYYVVADPHGFYTEMKAALDEKGFFTDTEPHKLIVCGDLFDRGGEAAQLQDLILDLMDKDLAILIRGNHEDLAVRLLESWTERSYLVAHHQSNGIVDTICQLTGAQIGDLYADAMSIGRRFENGPFMKMILPSMRDYYETEHYIFVHGWIPCGSHYAYIENWRDGNWDAARWTNGMEAAHCGVTVPEKPSSAAIGIHPSVIAIMKAAAANLVLTPTFRPTSLPVSLPSTPAPRSPIR